MNICIGGGSGFIGQYLATFFQEQGHRLTILKRSDWEISRIHQCLRDTDVVMNFVGESIMGPWTRNKKRRILDSRVLTTNLLAQALKENQYPVKLWINASAVGIYDAQHIHDESSSCFAENFMAEVVRHWEEPLLNLGRKDIRTIALRQGIVMGSNGGIMRKLQLADRLKIGLDIRVQKAFPFIHIHDLARAVQFSMEHSGIKDIVNAVGPLPITMTEFFFEFNAAVKPWIKLPVNETWIERILGESSILFTGGQQVVPRKLLEAGFTFDFPDFSTVVKDMLNLNRTL